MLFGVNIFDYGWKPTGRMAEVRDPLHGDRFCFSIYEVEIGKIRYEFAAGEFSNCIWGFYLPAEKEAPLPFQPESGGKISPVSG